eukprot:COSAG01_NODE_54167_length_334_cov_0.625532_1_plen_78_part_10
MWRSKPDPETEPESESEPEPECELELELEPVSKDKLRDRLQQLALAALTSPTGSAGAMAFDASLAAIDDLVRQATRMS